MSSTAKPPGPTNELRETIESNLPKDKQENPRSPHIKAQGGRPLTVEEVLAHPEYPHVDWDLPADKQGKINVAAGRGGPFKLAYETHGHGPHRILVFNAYRDRVRNSLTKSTVDNGSRRLH